MADAKQTANETPLHKAFMHFSEMPYSMRVVYTATLLILGMGYLFALIYLFHTYSGKDGNPMTLSYEDVVIAYSGSGKDSRLEAALRGSMLLPLAPWQRSQRSVHSDNESGLRTSGGLGCCAE